MKKSGYPKIVFSILCLLIGIILLHPYLNYQELLAQGDHGRDLYCFKKTFEGQVPYRDYWWQYGPLMPYYYSLFFKFFGLSIQSVLLGKVFLVLLCGIFLFLTASSLMPAGLALIAAIYFWIFRPEFFYTYNHVGGILMTIIALYSLFKYYRDPDRKFLYLGFLAIFLLNLIRLNIGIASLAAFIIALLIIHRSRGSGELKYKTDLLIPTLSLLAMTTLVYSCFIWGMPYESLSQCFPYLSAYRPDTQSPVGSLIYLGELAYINFTATWPRKIFAFFLIFALVRTAILFYRQKFERNQKHAILAVLSSLLLFVVFNIHEYLLSATIFRIAWIFPAYLLLFLYIIYIGFQNLPRWARVGVLIILAFFGARSAWINYGIVSHLKQPANLFEYKQNRLYIINGHTPPEMRLGSAARNPWIKTVVETARYVEQADKESGENRNLLALPYDSLYYFLTDLDAAVYPLAFFQYMHISPREEKEMIDELEQKNVNIVLISNRAFSTEPSLGIFGKDYCPLLAKYILENFDLAAQFGDWRNPAGFVENHGVRVLKRK